MGSRGKSGQQNQQQQMQDAQAKYQQDLANWRAPTTTGSLTPPASPVSNFAVLTTPGMNGDMGPALPPMGVPPAPPAPRTALAQTMNPQAQFYPGGGTSHTNSYGYGNSFGGHR